MIAAQSNLDAARRYAAQGLPVFPVVECGKQPAIKGGFHAATTNPATIDRYWRLADRNIGIATQETATSTKQSEKAAANLSVLSQRLRETVRRYRV